VASSRQQLRRIALVQVLAMGWWFSASAVVPSLREEWSISREAAALLTVAVQLGFVAGAVTSAVLNLADRVRPAVLIGACAAIGALATAAFAAWSDGLGSALVRTAPSRSRAPRSATWRAWGETARGRVAVAVGGFPGLKRGWSVRKSSA
jgi:hypothetical protein